jgi:hypothetical protein
MEVGLNVTFSGLVYPTPTRPSAFRPTCSHVYVSCSAGHISDRIDHQSLLRFAIQSQIIATEAPRDMC